MLTHVMAGRSRPAGPVRRRRTAVLLAAAMMVVGATAAWAYTMSGTFPEPAFTGQSWKLTVGEERNGVAGETYKVCYVFERRVGANMGNGLGTAGCRNWPSDINTPVITDLVPVIDTPTGVVLFIDLSTRPVAKLQVEPDGAQAVDVRPYVMPQTRKQFAAAELPEGARRATVRAIDHDGNVIATRRINDLTVRP